MSIEDAIEITPRDQLAAERALSATKGALVKSPTNFTANVLTRLGIVEQQKPIDLAGERAKRRG